MAKPSNVTLSPENEAESEDFDQSELPDLPASKIPSRKRYRLSDFSAKMIKPGQEDIRADLNQLAGETSDHITDIHHLITVLDSKTTWHLNHLSKQIKSHDARFDRLESAIQQVHEAVLKSRENSPNRAQNRPISPSWQTKPSLQYMENTAQMRASQQRQPTLDLTSPTHPNAKPYQPYQSERPLYQEIAANEDKVRNRLAADDANSYIKRSDSIGRNDLQDLRRYTSAPRDFGYPTHRQSPYQNEPLQRFKPR